MVTYKTLKCKYCSESAQNSRRAGTYKVLESENYLILKCMKCGKKQYIKLEDVPHLLMKPSISYGNRPKEIKANSR